MSSGAHNKPARKKTLVGMRAPVFPQEPAPSEEPSAPPQAEQAAASPPERPVADATKASTPGAGAWANALLNARVRSEPRRPSVPNAVDDFSDRSFTSSTPPSQEPRDDTERGLPLHLREPVDGRAERHRKDTPRLYPPRSSGPPGNAIGQFIDSSLDDDPVTDVGPLDMDDAPRPSAPELINVAPPARVHDTPPTDPGSREIRSLIEGQLDDDPVSEVGPLDSVRDQPGRRSQHPVSVRPPVDAPWGVDEDAGALPPLGTAVNSLSMADGGDADLATLEGDDGSPPTVVQERPARRGIGPGGLAAVLFVGMALGAAGLWWLQTGASTATAPDRLAERTEGSAPPTAAPVAPPTAEPQPPVDEAPEPQEAAPVDPVEDGADEAALEPAEEDTETETEAPEAPHDALPQAPDGELAEAPAADPAATAQEAAPLDRAAALAQATALVDKAVYLRRNGRDLEAIANYKQALTLHRGYGRAMTGLARVYLTKKDAQRALHWAKRLNRNQRPRAHNQLLLGDAQQLSGDAQAAQKAWTRAAALGSKQAESRLAN